MRGSYAVCVCLFVLVLVADLCGAFEWLFPDGGSDRMAMLRDGITSFLGALFGLWFALVLHHWGEKRTEEKAATATIQERRNYLQFVREHLRVIDESISQIEEKSTGDPLIIAPPVAIPTHELRSTLQLRLGLFPVTDQKAAEFSEAIARLIASCDTIEGAVRFLYEFTRDDVFSSALSLDETAETVAILGRKTLMADLHQRYADGFRDRPMSEKQRLILWGKVGILNQIRSTTEAHKSFRQLHDELVRAIAGLSQSLEAN